MTTTGLFQLDLYQIDEPVPAKATLTTDPLGQVVAVISAYLPEGFGSSLYEWQETAYLRADFVRANVDLVRSVEGERSIEGEWELDVHDDGVRDHLLRYGGDAPDDAAFAILASCAPDLEIAPPDADVRESWSGDRTFAEGVPDEDWPGPDDE